MNQRRSLNLPLGSKGPASLRPLSAIPLALAMVLGLSGCPGDGTGGGDMKINPTDGGMTDGSANMGDGGGQGDMGVVVVPDGGFVAPTFSPICTADNWCFNLPLPQGNTLNSVFSINATDVWAVGEGGFSMHLTGGKWKSISTGIRSNLKSVWAANGSDVWAVGFNGAIVHWNGSKWAATPSKTTMNLNAVWGSGGGDVWAAGDAGTLLSWNGSTWANVSPTVLPALGGNPNDLRGMFGFSASDFWIVGAGAAFGLPGTAVHYDGNAFTATTVPVNADLAAVWGLTPTDIWAVGSTGAIIHWNKSLKWTQYTTTSAATLHAVFGTSAKDVLAVGDQNTVLQYNGTAWTPASNVQSFAGVQLGLTNTWIVGASGSMAFFNGKNWIQYGANQLDTSMMGAGMDMTLPNPDMLSPQANLRNIVQITGSSAKDIWGIDSGSVVHNDGTYWTQVNTGLDVNANPLNSIWVGSPTNVWVAGENGIAAHYDGTKWTQTATNVTRSLHGVFGLSATEAWAVGDFTAIHYTGGAWVTTTTGLTNPLRAVWGTAANNIYAVGDRLAIIRWDGTKWNNVTPGVGTASFKAIWGASATAITTVGDSGTVAFFDGTQWSLGNLGPFNLLSVFGFANELYFAGRSGVLFHSTGAAPTLVDTATVVDLTTIWGASSKDVLAAGSAIIIEHKN